MFLIEIFIITYELNLEISNIANLRSHIANCLCPNKVDSTDMQQIQRSTTAPEENARGKIHLNEETRRSPVKEWFVPQVEVSEYQNHPSEAPLEQKGCASY
jgi:hypothetical protein